MAKSIQRLRMDQSATYRIKLQGRLNDEWSNWLRGMNLTLESTTKGLIVTTLTGPVNDQAELYGLLAQIRDLGLPLICVELVKAGNGKPKPELITSQYPARVVLENVPRAGYDIHLSPFPGSLFSVLQYINDPCDYDYIMGVSGAAFRRFWNREDGGNVDISYLGDKPFERIFEALGYEWQKIKPEKEAMIEAIKASLDRKIPAISFGIIGPPEAGIVTGYAQDGEVLFGWSYFQEDRRLYYEKTDWFETMSKIDKGLILIGNKKSERPQPRQVLIQSLEWALDLERTTQRADRPHHVCGLAAYDGWADGMEVDADYPPDNREILTNRVLIHGDQCVMLEERKSAANYLRQMIPEASKAGEYLNAASALYTEVGDLTSQIYPWEPWYEKAFEGLANPKLRHELATLVRLAKEKETKAVEQLEKALAVLR